MRLSMNNQDLPRFTQIFMGVCEIYQRNTSEVFIELYWRALQQFELSAVEAAFNAHTRDPDHGNRMPLPADIVRLLEGNRYTQASQAWSKLANAIKHVGAWESVVFDDAIIHIVVEEMGGWITLCHMQEKDTSYRAHEFMKRYSSYVLNKPKSYPSHLCGLVEQHNQQIGFDHQKLLLIGDKASALQILEAGKETKHLEYNPHQLLQNAIQWEQTYEKNKKEDKKKAAKD